MSAMLAASSHLGVVHLVLPCIRRNPTTVLGANHLLKRTPDNLYPNENSLNPADGWDCTNFLQANFALNTIPINHQTQTPQWHPFASRIWNGSCDSGQLTAGGLKDAIQHGKVQNLQLQSSERHRQLTLELVNLRISGQFTAENTVLLIQLIPKRCISGPQILTGLFKLLVAYFSA